MVWNPIYESSEDILNAKNCISKIVNNSISNSISGDYSLYQGIVGESLFLINSGVFLNNQNAYEYGLSNIQGILDNPYFLKEDRFSLFGGYVGFLWLVKHLKKQRHLFIDEKLFKIFSIRIENDLQRINPFEYDYINGYLGILPYLLFDPISNKSKINMILNLFYKIIIENDEYLKVPHLYNSDETKNEKYFLGLSHGAAGIIVILSQIYKITKDRKILSKIMKLFSWMVSCKINQESIYPTYIKDGEKPFDSALAWCHGDLGISISLLVAYNNTGIVDLFNESVQISNKTLHRTWPFENVKDESLCHGAVGIAHIYSRFYNYTMENKYKVESKKWYDLALLNFEKNFTNKSLFLGITGLGLSLISAISNNEPKWDKIMLLS